MRNDNVFTSQTKWTIKINALKDRTETRDLYELDHNYYRGIFIDILPH